MTGQARGVRVVHRSAESAARDADAPCPTLPQRPLGSITTASHGMRLHRPLMRLRPCPRHRPCRTRHTSNGRGAGCSSHSSPTPTRRSIPAFLPRADAPTRATVPRAPGPALHRSTARFPPCPLRPAIAPNATPPAGYDSPCPAACALPLSTSGTRYYPEPRSRDNPAARQNHVVVHLSSPSFQQVHRLHPSGASTWLPCAIETPPVSHHAAGSQLSPVVENAPVSVQKHRLHPSLQSHTSATA